MGSTAVIVSEAGRRRSHDGWRIITSLVLDGISSRHTRRAYSQALDEFLIWFRDDPGREFNKAAVQKYRAELEIKGLAPSSINVRLSAIRRLALEAADNGVMAPELAAGIARAKGAKRGGVRLGHWLTAEQAEQFLALPDLTTLKGIRDAAVLAILLGAGLRRSELASLDFEHIQSGSLLPSFSDRSWPTCSRFATDPSGAAFPGSRFSLFAFNERMTAPFRTNSTNRIMMRTSPAKCLGGSATPLFLCLVRGLRGSLIRPNWCRETRPAYPLPVGESFGFFPTQLPSTQFYFPGKRYAVTRGGIRKFRILGLRGLVWRRAGPDSLPDQLL